MFGAGTGSIHWLNLDSDSTDLVFGGGNINNNINISIVIRRVFIAINVTVVTRLHKPR